MEWSSWWAPQLQRDEFFIKLLKRCNFFPFFNEKLLIDSSWVCMVLSHVNVSICYRCDAISVDFWHHIVARFVANNSCIHAKSSKFVYCLMFMERWSMEILNVVVCIHFESQYLVYVIDLDFRSQQNKKCSSLSWPLLLLSVVSYATLLFECLSTRLRFFISFEVLLTLSSLWSKHCFASFSFLLLLCRSIWC